MQPCLVQELFRLGVFTSASDRTVNSVIPMMHTAAGQPLFTDRQLVLTRSRTEKAPSHHIENGGNAWDTVKCVTSFVLFRRKLHHA